MNELADARIRVDLDAEGLRPYASEFLERGTKQDAWALESVTVAGRHVTAFARMTSTYSSPTDPGGFHLSIFATLEMLSQISNVYLHLLAGYDRKTREVWMDECSIKCHAPIRDSEGITLEIEYDLLPFGEDGIGGRGQARVTGPSGGLFEVKLRGVLS